MIQERYVSLEVAKLLKEKGFNIPTHTFYNEKKGCRLKYDSCLIERNAGIYISAPTQQMVIDWLELKHNIFIAVAPRPTTMDYKRVTAYIYKIEERGYSLKTFIDAGSRRDAIDKAIKCSLEKLSDYETN